MSYSFNVSLNGRHFFATDEKSITTKDEAEKMNKVLREKFTADEGYSVSCSQWSKTGQDVSFDDEETYGVKFKNNVSVDTIQEINENLCVNHNLCGVVDLKNKVIVFKDYGQYNRVLNMLCRDGVLQN